MAPRRPWFYQRNTLRGPFLDLPFAIHLPLAILLAVGAGLGLAYRHAWRSATARQRRGATPCRT